MTFQGVNASLPLGLYGLVVQRQQKEQLSGCVKECKKIIA
jgi:hypothetical protein